CALAYAEFAAMVPVSGSAYTYTYATLGELAAWFIGWMLILEYGVSASAVAVSWTGYFLSLLQHFDITLPAALTQAPLDAKLRPTGAIANIPAATIVLLLTWLCYVGIRKSSAMNMAMVVLKSGLIVLVIVVGWKYVNPELWTPFIPESQGHGKYGLDGVLRGASVVFFAYIGFDAVSTAAGEAKNPQRDMPIGILGSLVICTVIYIIVSGVLTGLLPYHMLSTPKPVATALEAYPALGWLKLLVEVGAIA
ncbi:amino acid permease, partial [Streptomyces sp. S9]|nr:amino acid permease [Streptomyces sp. S9]